MNTSSFTEFAPASSRGLAEIPEELLSQIAGGLEFVLVHNQGATGMGIGFSIGSCSFGVGVGVGSADAGGFSMSFAYDCSP